MAKAKSRSRWRMRQIRHRDAVVLSVLSASFLLAGEFANGDIVNAYNLYIAQFLGNPAMLLLAGALTVLGFTPYFGGFFVLLGGVHFSWGRVGRGRFLVGFGVGLSALGLMSRIAFSLLTTGNPLAAALPERGGLTAIGIIMGIASHTLMGGYALLLKKHARRVWRRWRKAQPEANDDPRSSPARSSRRTARGARR
jgi:hypothetical protein